MLNKFTSIRCSTSNSSKTKAKQPDTIIYLTLLLLLLGTMAVNCRMFNVKLGTLHVGNSQQAFYVLAAELLLKYSQCTKCHPQRHQQAISHAMFTFTSKSKPSGLNLLCFLLSIRSTGFCNMDSFMVPVCN